MKSLVLIVPYFGKWPLWFDAHLCSISHNASVNWLFFTDCELPKKYPKNIRFISTSLEEVNDRINKILKVSVPLTSRKICDIRVAFGDVFAKDIQGYDFWGYCDVDIIWGNIRGFIDDEMLSEYDIISSRRDNTSGHFTIFKNNNSINSLYKGMVEFYDKVEKKSNQRMDEDGLTNHLFKIIQTPTFNWIKIKWDVILCNQENGIDSHQEFHLDKWLWREGKMVDQISNQEVMYLHFINWKRTMKTCGVNYLDNPSQFYISYAGIHYSAHSKGACILNTIKNVFFGYWIKEKRRIRILKLKKLKERIIRKIINQL